MTYDQIAKTFVMLSEHNPNAFVMDWAEHDEWGIDLSGFELNPKEIRMLAEMGGWGLGSDADHNEVEMQAWINPQNHTDEEIVKIFNRYKSIYKYA